MPKKRCHDCKIKIKSVLPIECKCKKYYCKLHKDPWEHNCSFDYINQQKEKLLKQNIKIISQKIQQL